jgi:hypothetical protein
MERLRMVDWWTCRSRHHASSSAGTVDLNNGAAGLHEPGLRRLALEGNGHAYRLATAIDAPTNAYFARGERYFVFAKQWQVWLGLRFFRRRPL